MAGKPRKSKVQNIIKNLLEMEIPEIQTASKELAEWIKQLEQHSFKLQHYATEIEDWASEEEEEVDSIELTDLIKDLEATLNDMRKARAGLSAVEADELEEKAVEASADKMIRGYGRLSRTLKEPKTFPRAEIKGPEPKAQVGRPSEEHRPAVEEVNQEQQRTTQGVLIAKDSDKTRVKAELPASGKEPVPRDVGRYPQKEEEARDEYLTPEGFLIRRLRP